MSWLVINFAGLYLLMTCICSVSPSRSKHYDNGDYYRYVHTPPVNEAVMGRNKIISENEDVVKDAQRPVAATCGLCLIIDEEFSRAYNIKDEMTLKVTLHAIVDQASWIFRSTDWDNDGVPDNIGFKTTSISYGWRPYKYETVTEYETPKPGLDLLKLFAKINFDNCCLGVGFTNRPFLYGLDGIAFGASDNLLGGICDHRNPKEESMANMNAVLVSGRGLNLSQLSPSQITRAFVHALGHAFGVHAHDNEYTESECWGFGPNERPARLSDKPVDGHYLMWSDRSKKSKHGRNSTTPEETELLQKNSLIFSRCSRYSISTVLTQRRKLQNCFEFNKEPYCGNGIVEGLEMCDCGNMFDCMEQTCCGSRQSPRPCSIINVKGCPTNIMLKIADQVNPQEKAASNSGWRIILQLDLLFSVVFTLLTNPIIYYRVIQMLL